MTLNRFSRCCMKCNNRLGEACAHDCFLGPPAHGERSLGCCFYCSRSWSWRCLPTRDPDGHDNDQRQWRLLAHGYLHVVWFFGNRARRPSCLGLQSRRRAERLLRLRGVSKPGRERRLRFRDLHLDRDAHRVASLLRTRRLTRTCEEGAVHAVECQGIRRVVGIACDPGLRDDSDRLVKRPRPIRCAEQPASVHTWGGLHYRFSTEAGVQLGSKIAHYGLNHAFKATH